MQGVMWTPTLYIQNKRNKRRNWMQDAYDKTLLNTSLFSYNKQVLIREKKTLCQCLKKCLENKRLLMLG